MIFVLFSIYISKVLLKQPFLRRICVGRIGHFGLGSLGRLRHVSAVPVRTWLDAAGLVPDIPMESFVVETRVFFCGIITPGSKYFICNEL